ncbi:MAG: tRNA (adenosine(37)-N6)-threonylcarbamoyltransferase complex ATPase subunit type 1 TsaE [Chloroflexia bacterium]|nr:tRNA (adenosine(37)-N6)-threonylcarbamoyltransferase complex ATPase subunit type 1 TsaE [Chloroflexia bacterium]
MPTGPLDPHVLDFVSHSAAQTRRLGLRLGRLLQAGDVLLFVGEFGSGKTTFIQGIGEGLGVPGQVTSPSFTLIWEHRADEEHGQALFYHMDLYRIATFEEALGLALEDYMAGEGICALEWADRVPEIMPERYLRIELSFLSETKRVVRMEPAGPRYVQLVEDFKRSAFG